MQQIQDAILPRKLLLGESLNQAVYCADCENLQQEIIGSKYGTCMEHPILDSTIPMECSYYKNAQNIVSFFIFLKSGISIYNKAITKDFTNEIDPTLLTSFLSAINSFGEEIAKEQISLIQFQRMNIIYCRGRYSNGALIIKGKLKDNFNEILSSLLIRVEESFPFYFEGEFNGRILPAKDVDLIMLDFLTEYNTSKLFPICPHLLEENCNIKTGTSV
jgi:hypothetical protein